MKGEGDINSYFQNNDEAYASYIHFFPQNFTKNLINQIGQICL